MLECFAGWRIGAAAVSCALLLESSASQSRYTDRQQQCYQDGQPDCEQQRPSHTILHSYHCSVCKYCAFQVQLAAWRFHKLNDVILYERRAATSLYKKLKVTHTAPKIAQNGK